MQTDRGGTLEVIALRTFKREEINPRAVKSAAPRGILSPELSGQKD